MLRSIFSVSPLPIWFSVVVLLLLLLFWFVRLFVVHWPVVVAFVYFCSICSVSIYASRKKMFVALFECKQHTLTQCSIIIYSNTSTSLLTCIQFICYRLIDLWLGFYITVSISTLYDIRINSLCSTRKTADPAEPVVSSDQKR